MFGYHDSEDITGNPVSLTHPEDLPIVLTELDKLIQNPNYTPTLQYRFKNKNGDWIWIPRLAVQSEAAKLHSLLNQKVAATELP